MTSKKLNLVSFKKEVLEFTVKYLCCGKCFQLVDRSRSLSCNHLYCHNCRSNGADCPLCGAKEMPVVEPLTELINIFNSLQTSLGIDDKVREKCFNKIYVAPRNDQGKITTSSTNKHNEEAQANTAQVTESGCKENQSKSANFEKKTDQQPDQQVDVLKDKIEAESSKDENEIENKDDRENIKQTNEVPVQNQVDEVSMQNKSENNVPMQDSEVEQMENAKKSEMTTNKKRTTKRKTRDILPEETEQSPTEVPTLKVLEKGTAKRSRRKKVSEDVQETPVAVPMERSKRSSEEPETNEKGISKNKKAKTTVTAVKKEPQESIRRVSFASPPETPRTIRSDIVVLSSNVNQDQLKVLAKFEKKFKCKCVNEYSENVTHFVTNTNEQNLGQRTLKYLFSLLGHKYLVSFDWIMNSIKKGAVQLEDEYELQGLTKQDVNYYGVPKISREQKKKIFTGAIFYLDGKFGCGGFPTKEDFRKLIHMGEGKLLETQAQLKEAQKANKKVYYVVDPQHVKSKFIGHENYIPASELLNIIMNFKLE